MENFIIYAVPIILILLFLLIVILSIITYRMIKLFRNSETVYLLEFGSRSEALKHLILLRNVLIKGCDGKTRAHIKNIEAKLKLMLEEK